MPLAIRPHSSVLALLGLATITLALVAIFAGSAGRSNAEQGQYLHFTGPDSGYIEVPDAPALNPTTEITIEAWVFITSGSAWGTQGAVEGCPTFVGKNYTLSYWFGLDCLGATNLAFYVGGEGTKVTSTGAVATGEWTHVAVAFDGTSVKFYINGVLDSTVPLAAVLGSSTNPLQIGRDFEWDSTPIGHIDEVHIWSVARSQAAIAADMDPITTPQIGLIGVWNMEGTPNADVGGFTGTLVGDAEFSGTPITPSPSPEPPFLKGDITCDHAITPGDAIPILEVVSGSGDSLPQCESNGTLSAQGFAQWWDASSGQGYIEIPDDTALNPTDTLTIELRVNLWSYLTPDGFGTCQSLVGKGYTTAYWLGICSGQLRFYSRGSGSQVNGESLIPLREWVHIAVVADQTSVKFYMNGELDSEFTNAEASLTTNTDPLRIGSDANYNFQPWAALSEVRIWNAARSQAEIQAEMNNVIALPQASLVAAYHLAGDTLDATGLHDGTAVDTVTFGSTLPSPYWPDINCHGSIDLGDVLPVIAYAGGIADAAPVPDDCEEIGTPTS